MQSLVLYNADVLICDNAGKTAEQYARLMGHGDIETCLSLKQKKATVDRIVSLEEEISRKFRTLSDHGLLKPIVGHHHLVNSRDSLDASTLEACINGHHRRLCLLIKKRGMSKIQGATYLHHAAAGGYLRCVQGLLEILEKWIDQPDGNGWTTLHYTAAGGFVAVVEELLEAGAHPEPLNKQGKTPLDIATEEGYRGVMEWLARTAAFSSDEVAAAFQWTQIHRDPRNGDLSAVERAIKNSEDLSPKDRFGRTPLARAAEMGCLSIVRRLRTAVPLSVEGTWDAIEVAAGSGHENVVEFLLQDLSSDSICSDKARSQSQYLLFLAADRGNKSIVKLLHGLGVSLRARAHSLMDTVFHVAVRKGHTGLVGVFAENGADIEAFNTKGKTALHVAVDNQRGEAIMLLLKHGADINSRIAHAHDFNSTLQEGNTPLRQAAVEVGCVDIVELLLQNGADATIGNTWGETVFSEFFPGIEEAALDLCTDANPETAKAIKIFKLFKRYQPQLVEHLLGKGQTPLHIAAAAGDTQAIRSLLEDGAFVDAVGSSTPYPTHRSHTPLHYAVEGGHVDAVNILLEFGAETVFPRRSWQGSDLDLLVDIAKEKGHNEVLQVLVG